MVNEGVLAFSSFNAILYSIQLIHQQMDTKM